jgi:ABC-2 type transport system permease protein
MILAQFRGEMLKLAMKRRTWLGFAFFAVLELVMMGICFFPSVSANFRELIESRGHSFEEYFSGLTLALLTMRTTVFFVATLFLALVAGDIVARETEDGSIRMILVRCASRFRVIALKYAAVATFTIALVSFIGLYALAISLGWAGRGNFFAFGFQDHVSTFHPFRGGVIRYLSSLPLLCLSLLTVTSVAFMFSCFDMKPATASTAALSIFFVDLLFRGMPLLAGIHDWLITARMGAWMQLFQPQIPWREVAVDYTILLALDASCVVIGWAAFARRDFKS